MANAILNDSLYPCPEVKRRPANYITRMCIWCDHIYYTKAKARGNSRTCSQECCVAWAKFRYKIRRADRMAESTVSLDKRRASARKSYYKHLPARQAQSRDYQRERFGWTPRGGRQ